MALNYVTVTCDLLDGSGNLNATGGFAYFQPSGVVTDTADHAIITQVPIAAQFVGGGSSPTVKLLATDNANLNAAPSWNVSFTSVPSVQVPSGFTFTLPAGPATFTASNGSPCVFTWTPTASLTTLPNGTSIKLSGGSLPTGFNNSTTYYVVSSSGTTFSLSASLDGTPINSSSTGSGSFTVQGMFLSAVTQVAPVAITSPFLLRANNLSDVASSLTARANLGFGSVSVRQFGAKGNTKLVTDGAMSSVTNTTTLTSATASFTAADVGKLVSVAGAGAAGAILSSIISQFTNSTTVILANAASTTVSGAKVTWGTDDTAAIQAAMNLQGPVGGVVEFPPGNYLLTNHLLWDTSGGTTASLAPSLIGVPGMAGPSIDAIPQLPSLGAVSLTAHSTFPQGEFIFDFIGANPAGGAAGNTGFVVSGFILYCNNRAAGLRSFNSENSDHSYMMINNAAAPAPANNIGSPLGAVNFLANPSFQSWNNVAERIYCVEAAQHSFYLIEGSGSYVQAKECNSVNAGWAGFYALKNTTLIDCLSQFSGKNNPQGSFYNSEFEIGGVIMVGCTVVASGAKGPGLILLAGAANINNVITGCTFVGTNSTGLAEKNAAIVYVINGGATAHHTTLSGCNFYTGSHTSDYVYVDSGTTGDITFSACHFLTSGGALVTTPYNLNGTNVLRFRNCEGINPAGTQSIAVPATTVATTALPFDATFYVTANAGGSCTLAISNGPTITLPASAVLAVRVPAGQTLTPTYTSAPTWVVEGE